MRRSAAVLERLAEKLPYSAVALCRLLRPGPVKTVPATNRSAVAPPMLHHTSSSSTVPVDVDVSGHSVDSSSRRATAPPPLPCRSDRRDSLEPKSEQTGRSSPGAVTSLPSPPPPPPPPGEVGARHSSCSSSLAPEVTAETSAAAAASIAPRLVEPYTGGAVGDVAVEEWGATGRDDGEEEEVM